MAGVDATSWAPQPGQNFKKEEVSASVQRTCRHASYFFLQPKVIAGFWNAEKGATVQTHKPSSTQRRKHQLNSLAFDVAAKQLELDNLKGSAFQTKAQTQAKYGW